MALFIRVPRQPEPFISIVSTLHLIHSRSSSESSTHGPLLSLAYKPDVGLAHAAALGLARVFGPIKDEHLARDGLGGDQVWVLRHVTRAIDLARVVDPLHDVDARLARGQRVPAELPTLIVVRATVEDVRAWPGARGDLHGRDL